jgi:hypothetical protein
LTRITPNLQDDEFTRRIADRAAVGRHRRHAALSIARTGQINTRKINGWNTLATKTITQSTSPLDQGTSHGWRSPREHCHHFSGRHQIANG